MRTRQFALIFGILYLIVGILGFVPGITTTPTDMHGMTMTTSYGYLFGLFPVNLLHNLTHVVIGILGIMAYRSFSGARSYARAMAIIFALLTVFGLIPGLDNVFGLIPLFGNDIWLHAVTAVISAVFGWFVRDDVRDDVDYPTNPLR